MRHVVEEEEVVVVVAAVVVAVVLVAQCRLCSVCPSASGFLKKTITPGGVL